jgi:hypothetical protein
MKTNKSFSSGAVRIPALLVLTLTILLVTGFYRQATAQLPMKTEAVTMADLITPEQPVMLIKSFTARLAEGVVYLNWTMHGEMQKSIFMVERSDNGREFETLGSKEGYPAPNTELNLLYCYSDRNPVSGIATYRIRQFRVDGVLVSDNVRLITDNQLPVVEVTQKK